MELLKIFEYNSTDFESTPLAFLENATNIVINQEINGDYQLSFELAKRDSKASYLKTNRIIIADNQPFRVFNTDVDELNVKVSAQHIFFDTEKVFIASVKELIDIKASEYMQELFKIAPATNIIELYDSSDIANLGMNVVDVDTDTEVVDRKSLCDCISYLHDNINQGEIYMNGLHCALVDEIKSDSIVRQLRLDRDVGNVKVTEDIKDLVTRAYVFGKDNLDLTSKIGVAYIDSDNRDVYGIREGNYSYSNISDVAMLWARASWLFDSSNQNRVDVPYTTIECSYRDLKALGNDIDGIALGNSYKVEIDGVTYERRIVKIEKNLTDLSKTKITLGRVAKDLFYFMKKMNSTSIAFYNSTKNIKSNPQMYTTIVEVTKQETLAADVLEAGAVFSTDIFTERFQTNITKYICKPNLVADGTSWKWKDEAHSYYTTNKDKIRGYIKMEGIEQKFIEAHLLTPADYANISESECEPLLVNGKQIYYTSVASGANAYQFFTFTEPKQKYNNISAENAAMFKVYIRKATAEYVKRIDKFELVDVTGDDGTVSQTYEVTTQYGTGDTNGNGIYTMTKHSDKCKLTYKSRTDGAEVGYIIDDNGTKIIRNDIEMINIAAREVDSINEMSGENWKDGDIGFIVS